MIGRWNVERRLMSGAHKWLRAGPIVTCQKSALTTHLIGRQGPCNQGGRYWLYVFCDRATQDPRILRVQDPFGKLVVRAKGGVRIDETAVFDAAEGD
jgi:hypothetical protein